MKGQNVSITEAARNFSDFVNRVAYRGESFFLIRGKRRVASLKPAQAVISISDLQQALMDLPALEPRERERWLEDLKQLRGRAQAS
ncbi:MAG: hypothetical protein AAF649_06540 [Verrucomicrobiota bacterium]